MSIVPTRIGEVLELQRRSVTPEFDEHYTEIGVRSFARGLFVKEPVSGVGLGDKRVFRIEPGDLVVSNVFAWEGAVAVADARHEGTIGSHRFMTWTPKVAGEVDAQFLAHYFASDPGLESLRKASPGSAGRNRTLSIKNFEAIEVPLPSTAEQRNIAGHLEDLRSIDTGASLEWRWARRFKTRLLDEYEADAARHPLREYLTQVPGQEVDAGSTYEIAGVYSFGRGLLRRPSIQGTQTRYKTLTELPAGAVVYSKLGAFEGAVAVVHDQFAECFVSPEFPTFTVSDAIEASYLEHYLTSMDFEGQLAAATAGVGARQKRVSPVVFLNQMIPVPARPIQRRVAGLLERVDRVQACADRANAVRGALLPAARNEIFSSLR